MRTRLLPFILGLLLVLPGQVAAGVVDDAEEVLKQVETDGPGLRVLRQSPPPAVGQRSQFHSQPDFDLMSSPSPNRRNSSTNRSRSPTRSVANPEPPPEDSKAPRRKPDSKQKALSFGGLVLLLGLVALAAALSRKLGGDEGVED